MTEEFILPDSGLHFIVSVRRFSTLTKLLRVTVIVSRFIQPLRNPVTPPQGPIIAVESSNARTHWKAMSLEIHGVLWKFIPEKAPCLKKVLDRAYLSLPVLQTMIVEVEAVVNNRPITNASSDINDPQPITPAHILYALLAYHTSLSTLTSVILTMEKA